LTPGRGSARLLGIESTKPVFGRRWKTLATMKNPPILFAKQANIAAGPQQVNWTATSLLARMPAFGQKQTFEPCAQTPTSVSDLYMHLR